MPKFQSWVSTTTILHSNISDTDENHKEPMKIHSKQF